MIEIDLTQIESAVREQVSKRIKEELNNLDLVSATQQILVSTLHDKIDVTVNSILNTMIKDGSIIAMLRDKLDNSLQSKLDDAVRMRVSSIVSNVDLGTEISNKIGDFVTNKMSSSSLPSGLIPLSAIDTRGLSISADNITQGSYKNFSSTGIQDMANSVELTLMDNSVIVEHKLISDQLSIQGAAEFKGSVNVMGDLRIEGNLVLLNPAFKQQVTGLVEDRLSKERSKVIDIGGDAILSNGKTVLTADTLGPGIAFSNLRKVGNLQDLNVIGQLTAAGTVHISDGMLGVNTDSPYGALTIWDEDTELSIRKHKSKTTYIGTSRDCDLAIGTNGNPAISITRDGSVSVDSLTIDAIKISLGDSIPESIGNPGDLVIMKSPKADQPWAYQCLGGNIWSALKR